MIASCSGFILLQKYTAQKVFVKAVVKFLTPDCKHHFQSTSMHQARYIAKYLADLRSSILRANCHHVARVRASVWSFQLSSRRRNPV